MAEVRKHIVFHGRVQGVGFRYTAKYLANSLNLVGWVQNCGFTERTNTSAFCVTSILSAVT